MWLFLVKESQNFTSRVQRKKSSDLTSILTKLRILRPGFPPPERYSTFVLRALVVFSLFLSLMSQFLQVSEASLMLCVSWASLEAALAALNWLFALPKPFSWGTNYVTAGTLVTQLCNFWMISSNLILRILLFLMCKSFQKHILCYSREAYALRT